MLNETYRVTVSLSSASAEPSLWQDADKVCA
jgi:hypothetical protein